MAHGVHEKDHGVLEGHVVVVLLVLHREEEAGAPYCWMMLWFVVLLRPLWLLEALVTL